MKHLASRGDIDDKSLIVHIIEGIPDEASNKIILYEASTLTELKDKLRVYETIKSQKKKADGNSSGAQRKVKNSDSKSRCGNCGSISHISLKCPHKSKGARCFRCNEFGHIAPNCPRKEDKNSQQNKVNLVVVPDLNVIAYIQGHEIESLVDTGSDVSLIKESLAKHMTISEEEKGPSSLDLDKM